MQFNDETEKLKLLFNYISLKLCENASSMNEEKSLQLLQ
jgi:hypothetical protein